MHGSTAAGSSVDWFKPTRGRLLFAVALAGAAFLLPQEVPIEWYPLNEPGSDILYLEISCAASVPGQVQIFYNLTRGINEVDSIRWPVAPSAQPCTYTFPLPDAPIVELRVDPLSDGGVLNVRQMRIINRRGEEIRRFTRDMFRAEHEIAAISPSAEGWKLVSTAGATDPYTRVELYSPIVPVGLDHRNLLRCLLSTGYLGLMLWLLLLLVLFIFHRPKRWSDLLGPVGFMAGLAVLFAAVGNRGLIRNSVHSARYVAPAVAPGMRLEFDLVSSGSSIARLFWDEGQGYRGAGDVQQEYEPHQGLQVLRLGLPDHSLRALRFSPRGGEGRLEIRGIRVVDAGQRTRAVLAFDSLVPGRDVARLDRLAGTLVVETAPGATDPALEFTPAAVALINRALGPAAGTAR